MEGISIPSMARQAGKKASFSPCCVEIEQQGLLPAKARK
jgi:hypothetical protein